MTREQVISRVVAAKKAAGSYRKLGKAWGVSAAHLCDIVHGRRGLGPSVLVPLGLERVVVVRETFEPAT